MPAEGHCICTQAALPPLLSTRLPPTPPSLSPPTSYALHLLLIVRPVILRNLSAALILRSPVYLHACCAHKRRAYDDARLKNAHDTERPGYLCTLPGPAGSPLLGCGPRRCAPACSESLPDQPPPAPCPAAAPAWQYCPCSWAIGCTPGGGLEARDIFARRKVGGKRWAGKQARDSRVVISPILRKLTVY